MVVLQPPAGRSAVQIDDDIEEAFAGARAGVPEHITSEDLASLGGRNTRGFVSRGHPAVHYKTLYPACGKSLLNFAPRSLTDRYVLLLLRKGYWWSVIP
jgi:hypothetical protein